MADLAAQREARRKKITENAEARMNRLLGLTKKTDQNNDSPPHSASPKLESEEPAYNTRLRSRGSDLSASPTSRHIPASATSITTADRSANRHADEDTLTRSHTPDIKDIIAQEAVLQPPVEKSSKSDLTEKKIDVSPKNAPGLDAHRLEIIRVVIVVLTAWLAHLVLKFDFGFLLFESILVPYLVLEITFEYVVYSYLQHLPLHAGKGNLISAALMLCGMKQNVLDTYNKIMAHVNSWISDFCLYVFSFVVWYSFIA